MRIITRAEFMKLPVGAICCEGERWTFGGWFRKDGNCGEHDYFCTRLDWTQFSPFGELVDDADFALENGKGLALHFDDGERDGCFVDNALYCVLEDGDIDVLVARLLEGKGKAL